MGLCFTIRYIYKMPLVSHYQSSVTNSLHSVQSDQEAIYSNHMFCYNSCIQSYDDQNVSALIEASRETIPVNESRSSNRPCIAGWNEHFLIMKRKALFWHQLWKSNNCSKHGFTADIRRKTHVRYHQAIRLTGQNK